MASKLSIQKYRDTVKMLTTRAKSHDLNSLLDYIAEAELALSTKIYYLTAIIQTRTSGESSLGKIREYRDKLVDELQKERERDNFSTRQREIADRVDYTDIVRVVGYMREDRHNSVEDMVDYLLLKISLTTPLRNDLGGLLVTRDKRLLDRTDNNWAYVPSIGDCFIVINRHKTYKTNGPIILNMGPEISDDIRWLTNERFGRYLFETKKGGPYSTSAYTHKLNSITKRYLGTPFGSVMFRKLYLTEKYGGIYSQMETDAKQMGNSVNAQKIYYISNKK